MQILAKGEIPVRLWRAFAERPYGELCLGRFVNRPYGLRREQAPALPPKNAKPAVMQADDRWSPLRIAAGTQTMRVRTKKGVPRGKLSRSD